MDLKLIDQKELAHRLGVHRNTIAAWKRLGKLPIPIVTQSRRSYWTEAQIEEWQKSNAHLRTISHNLAQSIV